MSLFIFCEHSISMNKIKILILLLIVGCNRKTDFPIKAVEMKNKIILNGGPFDGHVGEAHQGVTEFWKRDGDREYMYSRVDQRTFRYDKRWRKMRHTNESKRLPVVRQKACEGQGSYDGCATNQPQTPNGPSTASS